MTLCNIQPDWRRHDGASRSAYRGRVAQVVGMRNGMDVSPTLVSTINAGKKRDSFVGVSRGSPG